MWRSGFLVSLPSWVTPKAGSSTRKGVLKCKVCRKQFTVTVGTVFEDSHIKLTKWIQAIYLIGASKKGISAHQLHRMLGVTYRAAWFMAHRLRYAMTTEPLATKLSGTVEVDEGYIGGKRKGGRGRRPADGGRKAAVAVLVERNGNVRAMPMERIDGGSMERAIRNYVEPGSRLMTDETAIYPGPNVKGQQQIAGMERHTVNHGTGEFVRGDVYTNTAEGFISLLKRGIVGTFHHIGKGHLGKYVSEFEFRYNARKVADKDRPVMIVQAGEGKRLPDNRKAAIRYGTKTFLFPTGHRKGGEYRSALIVGRHRIIKFARKDGPFFMRITMDGTVSTLDPSLEVAEQPLTVTVNVNGAQGV